MKMPLVMLCAAVLLAGPAVAQEKKEMTEQQKRMQSCNADAKKREFKDNEARQAFMSACLKGEKPPESAAMTSQQQRMKSCNADAAKMQFKDGSERQAFMSKCLKG
jgi:psiF repeat